MNLKGANVGNAMRAIDKVKPKAMLRAKSEVKPKIKVRARERLKPIVIMRAKMACVKGGEPGLTLLSPSFPTLFERREGMIPLKLVVKENEEKGEGTISLDLIVKENVEG